MKTTSTTRTTEAQLAHVKWMASAIFGGTLGAFAAFLFIGGIVSAQPAMVMGGLSLAVVTGLGATV